jgi:hypothetical protein
MHDINHRLVNTLLLKLPTQINGCMKRIFLFVWLGFLFSEQVNAQQKISFKDSLDGKFDMSEWVLTAHGFIPIVMLITEPALGGLGCALFPVFISRNEPYVDTVDNKVVKEHIRQNIYGAGGAYTANGTWLVGGMCSGVIKKWRSNYRVGAAYANLNLEFYRDIPQVGEKSFLFNFKGVPVFGQLIKQLKKRSSWYAGLDYLFLKTEIMNTNAEFHTPKEINSKVSKLSALIEYDHRDNIFTPDKGLRWNTLIGASDKLFGSDYNYQSVNSAAFAYLPLRPNLIAGFRAEYQEVWGDVPFYLKPYISLRGIPVERYQGNITSVAETELRWDFNTRFSAVGFCGAGKAINDWSEFTDVGWHVSGGGGFRYLVVRKLKLRMGIDLARGPEQWAYYMVFGTTWVR